MAAPNYNALEKALKYNFFSGTISSEVWPALNESVVTVLMILELFAHPTSEITTLEIAKRIDIHLNTARLFLAWMERNNLLERLNLPSRGNPSTFKAIKDKAGVSNHDANCKKQSI